MSWRFFFFFLATFLYRTLVFSALFLQSFFCSVLLLLCCSFFYCCCCCCRCRCRCWPEHDVALSSNVFVQMFRGALRQRLLKIFNRKTLPTSLPLLTSQLPSASTQLRLFSQTGLQKTTESSASQRRAALSCKICSI